MSSLRGTKQTKAIQSNPALRGKNTSKLNQYKYQNQTAIDTINKYNELMNSGGWMSADDLTKYNSAIETYKTTGTALRDASKFYGTKYTEEEEKGWLDSLASLSNSYTSANELYSSFADADQFTNWWNYNTGKNEYHSVTGAEDYLQNSQYVKGGQDSRYDFINQGKGYSVPIAGMGADDLVAGFTSWLPDPARDAIGSALGYSEPLPDVDYSEFISDFFTGLVKGNPDAAMYTNNGDLELTDEEIGVYNYYYATQGKEKAEEYLKFIEEEIRQRKAGIDYANFKAADKLMDALLKTDTGNLGEYVYGYGAGVESGLAGLANMNALVKGTEGYTPASQYVSSMIRNDLGGKNGELTLEQVFYDLANTTGNMTPSLVVGGAAGPLAGAITMGLSSAGNNYTSFLKENYGVDAARAYGIITGVSEAGMSYLFSGIGKLGGKLTSKLAGNIASGLNNAAARIAVDFGKSFIGEAFEEAAQTALEPVFKWAATLGEAELEAINWEEVGYSALLGGLSGGMLEGVPSLVQTGLQSHAAYTNAGGSTFGGVVDALINPDVDFTEYVTQNAQNVTDTAVDYANELESIDPGNKAAQYVLKKAEAGKNISGYQINRLANEINSTNQEAVKSAVKTRLVELGEGVMAGKVADVITKVQLGQAITSAEEAILNTSKNAYLVLTESDAENIKGGGLANKWSESIIKNLDSKNGGKKVKTPIAVRPEEEKESVGVNAEDSGKRVDSGITAVEIDGDNAVFTLANGEKVSADKMEYASDNHREVANIAMERTTRVPGFTAEVASAMIKGYDGASSVSDYSAAINDAYRYGYQGIPMAEISTGKNTSLIKNKTALYTAYDAGKQYAKSATTRPAFVGTKGKDAKGSVTIDKKIDQSKLTKEQRQQIKALDIIANALGINITVFESPVNAQGQHIGINGKYNTETHSIEIDLHAGADGRGVMLFTASHELTHHIRNVAADKFKVFADAVFEEIGKTGRSVDALIEKRVEEMRGKKDYKGLSEEKLYDKAYEEVVADAAESMLTDSDALARLSEKIKGKDKNLWDTIKSFFNDLVKEIKALYRQFNPDSLEGSLVRDMGDAAERLQNLWVEGLMEASEAGTEISAEEETMVSLDTKSESVSPEMFSERTWTASEYVTAREEMANKIANALGVSVRKAKKYIDDVNSIAKLIANDRARLDYEASSFGSAFVSNVEYGGSFDYTTLCKKRRIYTGTFTEIQKRLRNTALSPDDILKIRNLLIEEGIEATCGLCYVEGSRANMGKFAKKFIELYQRDFPDGWVPDMADVNTPDGVEKMRINHPEVYEKYEYFWNHYGKLQDSDPALFASQQKPKLYEARKEYKGEILAQFKKDSSIEKKNLNGGIRMQSFSDFEIVHLIDTMQVIMDMSTVGLAGQAYTKVPEFAKAFGNTGLKINLSLIAKGVDADGKLIFDDREGMPHETAFELRNQYSKNVGTIIVTFTDEQLMAAMADERIDFIIPFHRSQWKKGQYGAMGLPKGTKDYTFMQNEKLIKQTYHEYQGRQVKDKATNYMPNEYWDFSKSGKENAEAYLKMCAENNKRPKFYKLLDYDGEGTYSLKADGSTDGYWKLLVDFKMYDNNGVGSPQAQVVPKFNMDEAYKMLDEYEGGHAQYPVAHGVVDKFVSEYEGNVKYQERISVDDAFSNRALLANALSSTEKSDAEADLLESYKKKIGELNSMNEELSAVQTQIDTLMKTVKIGNEKMSYATFQKQARQQAKKIGLSTENLEFGKRDNNYVATINGDVILKAERVIRTKAQNERLHELQNIAKELEQEITKKDKKLLELEATKALKDVVERERQQAYKAAAEKGREALRRNVEGRHKSEARAKIKGLKEKFMGMLEHPTERQYVPSDLVSAMVKVCELVDTSTALIKSNGEINKAQQARNEQMQRLINLAAEYKKIKNNPDAMIAEEYEAEIADYLDEIVANYASKNIADMTLDELNELYRTMKAIEETLRDARKLIGWTDAESVYDAGDSIIEEQRGIAATRKQNGITRADDVVVNMSLSPMRAVLRMGGYNEDSALYRAMRDIERGTREQKKFVMDAVKKFESLTTGKNADVYEKAIYDPYGKELVDKNGKKFHVTKMQMMQAVMSYEREMANEKLHHVSNGGFTFADIDLLGKGEIREAVSAKNAHTVTLGAELALQFQMELANDQWAQDYMAEARRFFDETAKDAINEANMKLKHRIIATGKNYIPYEVNSDYIVREITSENDIQQVISGYGMLKDLKAGATQPIIITGLNNVLDRHIEQVGNVAALAVPIRNFNKIWNVKAADGSTTVKEAISNNWGTRGTDLITQAVKDVQGSRIQDRSDLYKAYKVVKSNIIGATFLGNVSVVLKQVGSMYTATSMLGWRNPVSMIGNLFATKANRDAIAAEVNKYTAVAWIRGQGLSDAELYELKTAKKKSKIGRAIDKLPNAVKATSWITQMDYDVALSLWKYAKEDVAKRTGLEGEELLQATAEYYNDVIENTQSMSDALHRPEIQKSDNIASETLGIFKTDLYQSAGLLRVAVENVKANPGKESNKALVKALGGTFMSMCWGSLITSLMAALRYKPDRYRDDEDDEITLGSWLKVAAGDMVEEMFGYAFPLFGSEAAGIISAFINGESYEFDNLTLDAVNDLLKAFTSVGATFNEEDFFSEKAGKAWKNLLIKAAAVFGVPANNVTRFIDAVRLHAQDIANGEFLSFEAGLTSKNPTRLYNAYIDGDADKIEKASRNYEDEKAVNEALRLQLRERDPRMQEIAQCELLGDTKRSVALEKDIVAEGHFDKDEVVGKAINAEINYVKEKLKDLKTAQKEGKTEDAEAIIKALIKRGYTQAFIDAYLKKIS